MMRFIGITLVIVGFLWISWDASNFVAFQHSRWMWESQQLPAGESIQRADAVRAMRDLSMALTDKQRLVLIPASLMLVGGFASALGGRKMKEMPHAV